MLSWKYNSTRSKVVTGILFSFVLIWCTFNIFALAIYGLNYIHSSIVTVILSLIYFSFCVYLDEEIIYLCEKMAFVAKFSRKYKFYTLFSAIAMFTSSAIFCAGLSDTWVEHTDWLINTVDVS